MKNHMVRLEKCSRLIENTWVLEVNQMLSRVNHKCKILKAEVGLLMLKVYEI